MVQACSTGITLNDIQRLYGLEVRTHRIGGLDLRVAQVVNVDALVTDFYPGGVSRHGDSPVWMITWPAALGLAEYLLGTVQVEGLQVLELGCGTAAAGVALARAGAGVVCTDNDAGAVEMALYNARLNECRSLRARALDWYHPEAEGCFDLIIGSEVAYFQKSFRPLLNVIRKYLKPGGTAFISDQCRPQGEAFLRLCDDEGMCCRRHTWIVHLPEQSYTIRITDMSEGARKAGCEVQMHTDNRS